MSQLRQSESPDHSTLFELMRLQKSDPLSPAGVLIF